jgi:hypothetical protein
MKLLNFTVVFTVVFAALSAVFLTGVRQGETQTLIKFERYKTEQVSNLLEYEQKKAPALERLIERTVVREPEVRKTIERIYEQPSGKTECINDPSISAALNGMLLYETSISDTNGTGESFRVQIPSDQR